MDATLQAALVGALVGAFVVVLVGLSTVKAEHQNRSVAALLPLYDWYRKEENVVFRRRVQSGGLDLKEGSDDDVQWRNYSGRLEFLAILIRYGLIAEAPATEIFGNAPAALLFRARDWINADRKRPNRGHICRRLQEWVALQQRGWIGRRWPISIYLWWYWTLGKGKGNLVPFDAYWSLPDKTETGATIPAGDLAGVGAVNDQFGGSVP